MSRLAPPLDDLLRDRPGVTLRRLVLVAGLVASAGCGGEALPVGSTAAALDLSRR